MSALSLKEAVSVAVRRIGVTPDNFSVLSLAERREMQELLLRRGFDAGEADSRFGPKTRAAIRDYQASSGLVPDGFASATILTRLRNQ